MSPVSQSVSESMCENKLMDMRILQLSGAWGTGPSMSSGGVAAGHMWGLAAEA